MIELIVISGKGGTGKTSVIASFAALAEKAVVADCDVDAADLHMVLSPKVLKTHDFTGGSQAAVIDALCTSCGTCERLCRFDAVRRVSRVGQEDRFEIDALACEGCGVCSDLCPADAIAFEPVVAGQWFESQTQWGPLIHARLGVGQDNSGKLVAAVRAAAREVAEKQSLELLLVDGAQGIGCPVIASLTGANGALIVTEPTLSGLHDMQRVAELTAHFKIPAAVCINKWDINKTTAATIAQWATDHDIPVLGRISYDPVVTAAQIAGQPVVTCSSGRTADEIRTLWEATRKFLAAHTTAKESLA